MHHHQGCWQSWWLFRGGADLFLCLLLVRLLQIVGKDSLGFVTLGLGEMSQETVPMAAEGVRKRDRGEAIDMEDDQGDVRATSSSRQLEFSDLMALMKKSMADNDSNFKEVKSEVSEAKAAAQESRVLAAKATTIAQETKAGAIGGS